MTVRLSNTMNVFAELSGGWPAALNCYQPRRSPFPAAALKKSDLQLQETFREKKIGSVDANAALVNHEVIDRHEELEDFDQAENLFYGDFDLSCPRGFKNIVRVTHRLTPGSDIKHVTS